MGCGEFNCPVPASAALWQVAEALGVLNVIPPTVQDKLSRMIVWPAGRPKHRPQRPLVDMFSPDLEAVSFSFYSRYPQKGANVGKAHGVGDVRVDFKNRKLFMQSEARNLSSGIPEVTSQIVYLDDNTGGHASLAKPLLMLYTHITDYQTMCWSV